MTYTKEMWYVFNDFKIHPFNKYQNRKFQMLVKKGMSQEYDMFDIYH